MVFDLIVWSSSVAVMPWALELASRLIGVFGRRTGRAAAGAAPILTTPSPGADAAAVAVHEGRRHT
jgi:hypothetical protein